MDYSKLPDWQRRAKLMKLDPRPDQMYDTKRQRELNRGDEPRRLSYAVRRQVGRVTN